MISLYFSRFFLGILSSIFVGLGLRILGERLIVPGLLMSLVGIGLLASGFAALMSDGRKFLFFQVLVLILTVDLIAFAFLARLGINSAIVGDPWLSLVSFILCGLLTASLGLVISKSEFGPRRIHSPRY